MVDLKAKPFYLNNEQIRWVEDTYASMDTLEKVQQLFFKVAGNREESAVQKVVETYKQGGLRWQGGDSKANWKLLMNYQKYSKIPLLIAANLDDGGNGCMTDGTFVMTAAGAAASGDTETAYNIGYVAGKEASAIGVNWLFNPCADIYMNWRNTIVNTRSYGDNADTVIKNIRAFIEGVHQSNVACCCKHFPGDGVEERDQHLQLGVNDLSAEEWDNSFRKVYQTMIDEGLESIMVGHIALPEMSRKLRPGIKDRDIMPATLAPELLTDLLRGEMGFNGVVLTDASHMGGFTNMKRRKDAVPTAIMAGCDMFLFTGDDDEDLEFMLDGVKNGMITEERLSDAVHRILGLKAKLNLMKPEYVFKPEEGLSVVGCPEHKALCVKAADACTTLVKDTDNLLPLAPGKGKRARLYYLISRPATMNWKGDPNLAVIKEEIERLGYEVDVAPNYYQLERDGAPDAMPQMMSFGKHEDFRAKYDVVFLVVYMKGYAQENNVRVVYSCGHSNEMPWYAAEVPTVGISLNYTNHLIDLPQVHTYIHAYGPDRACIRAALEKAHGMSEFKGTASETVFCGKWDTRL
ncbi:MAG: glycosyl hydrolase [Faecalibacterium sp.]|nr:glycosyl hydrolase [Faecalibacterium sp.]